MPVTALINRTPDDLKGKRNYVRYVAGQGSPVGDSAMSSNKQYPAGSEYVDLATNICYVKQSDGTWKGSRFVFNAQLPLNGDSVDQFVFIAPRACKLVGVSEVHRVAGTDGGAVTMQVEKCTGTQAPDAGTALLTNNSNAGFNMKGAANTVQTGALVATAASVSLAAGDRLSLDIAGTITSLAGVVVTFELEWL